jgi:hypothetical protein
LIFQEPVSLSTTLSVIFSSAFSICLALSSECISAVSMVADSVNDVPELTITGASSVFAACLLVSSVTSLFSMSVLLL